MKTKFITLICLFVSSLAMAADWSGSDAAQLKRLEAQWVRALIARDGATLNRVLADEYVYSDPAGGSTGRKLFIRNFVSGKTVVTSAQTSSVRARVIDGTGIVTGWQLIKGRDGKQDISGRYLFMDVFVKRNGVWRAVATQLTPVH